MAKEYFNIPYYKRLTSENGWTTENPVGTHFHVARAFFQMNTNRPLPGASKIGQKLGVLGHGVRGFEIREMKTVEITKEVLEQVNTVKQSIIDSESLMKLFDELTVNFGDGKIINLGGKIGVELSSKIRQHFGETLNITNSFRRTEVVKYEFSEVLPADFDEIVCGVEVYQRYAADLYLIQVDFLNVEYKTSMFGLRKKRVKYPFPENSKKHPNVIKIGVPVATIEYWKLLPQSSRWIRDADYNPDVLDDSDIEILTPDNKLKARPYWRPQGYPTLYQLSNVAFPLKWVNRKNNYEKEELMKIELEEAEMEKTLWFLRHGPGRKQGT